MVDCLVLGQIDMLPNNSEYTTYVLSLGGGNIYVGSTTELERRLHNHRRGNKSSSIWVRTHGMDSVLEVRPGGKDEEKRTTIRYMQSHGYDKVRGHVWTHLKLDYDPSESYPRQ
jgi:predicted GIY-YIG superfamily endonuclease